MNGMSEICIDCVHQEVCRYECYCPSGHCNDYAVADDFRPQDEWVRKEDVIHSIAKQYSEHNELVPIWLSIGDMKGGAE